MTNGYILLPRSLKLQPWYHKPASRLLALHLLQEVSYKAIDHPTLGLLSAGTYLTTYRRLATELGVTLQVVRTALAHLQESGFIEVATLTKAIKVVVTWPDFVKLRDGDIMLNNTIGNTIPNTMSNTIANSATNKVSATCEDCESAPNTMGNTMGNTTPNTAYKNKDKLNITNTHTRLYNNPGITKSAPAREAHTHTSEQAERVATLLDWMAKRTPEVFQMEEPFTDEALRWMCATYPLDALMGALSRCSSNGKFFSNRFASDAFQPYLDNDYQLNSSLSKGKAKMYTYDEVCDMVTSRKYKQEDFTLVKNIDGKGTNRWLKV